MRILILDDQPINIDIMTRYASRLTDVELVTFLKPHDALDFARAHDIDLVLTDYQMPEMNGVEFLRAFRALDGKATVPVIMITAEGQKEIRYKALEDGANDFLNKPVDGTEFLARARNMLALRLSQNELQAKNKTLAEINAQLEELNTLKSNLMAIAATDLNDPLHSILNFTDSLLYGKSPAEQQAQFLRIIQDLANRMAHILNEVLSSDAIEKGTLKFTMRPIAFDQLVRFAVDAASLKAQKKGQEIRLTMTDSVYVYGDELRLQEIVGQLLSNAIVFSPQHSVIDVTLTKEHQIVRFVVRDYGPGISESEMPLLFKKFQRLSAKPTGGEASSGIGLSLIKQLAEHHQGSLTAESEGLGKGSTFMLRLPIHTGAA